MLKDRKRVVERMASNTRYRRQMVEEYGAFLRTLFIEGDWFVTLTFRDRHQDSEQRLGIPTKNGPKMLSRERRACGESRDNLVKCARDPRLDSWEPDSRNRREPGPPVRDAALREIEHWLLELGWEAAGRKRQEIFDRLADGLSGRERRDFAKALSNGLLTKGHLTKGCLICALLKDPVTFAFYCHVREIATRAIGWVIAEEFGRIGGRWHVHLLIRGVQHVRRRKWWKRAFRRFGRNRIEPIHG